MTRIFQKRIKKAALPPGTVQHIGERLTDRVTMTLIEYDPERLVERELADIADSFGSRDNPPVSWININGLHDTEVLTRLGEHFAIHPLVLEDIAHTHQRPKMEDHESFLYIVLKMLQYDPNLGELTQEQVSFILGPNFVISFQEQQGDVFDPVRERLRQGKGRIRKAGPDYLTYALLDAIVDNYFQVLEAYGDRIEVLEDKLLENPGNELLQMIHDVKRDMIIMRRSVWPLREVVGGLEKTDSELVQSGTSIFLRDLYDHTIQVIEAVESFRDMISGMQDLYLSSISNRMNEVMKVLTIIATIFVPLTFVAGIYGMNFEHMPELSWKWSYGIFWVVILVIAGFMLRYFRGKHWF